MRRGCLQSLRRAKSDIKRAEWLRARRTLMLVASAALGAGLIVAGSLGQFFSYCLVAGGALLAPWIWIRMGAPGIPTLPAVSALYFLYFALPILRANDDSQSFSSGDIIRAAATILTFLVAATITWRMCLRQIQIRSAGPSADLANERQIAGFISLGLTLGIVFMAASVTGHLGFLGSFLGLARSIAVTAASVASYFIGCLRARGRLKGNSWLFATCGLAVLVVLAWSSLFLVGGLTFILSATLGYAITAKKIPWKIFAIALPVVAILHAGKAEMRRNNWFENTNYGNAIGLGEVPFRLLEWTRAGVVAMASGEAFQDVIARASLFDQLLQVQRLAPDDVPYLDGATYALLPSMLVPRFIFPDKLTSQSAMVMLNVHFGFQTTETANVTALGWGIVPEALANFGYPGVIGAGLVFGLLCGLFSRWSSGGTMSIPTLAAIAAMTSMVVIEADLAYLLTNIWQGLIAVILCAGVLRIMPRNTSRLRTAPMRMGNAGRPGHDPAALSLLGR